MADDRLVELMATHMRMPFPPGCRGQDIDGVDLILVGADVYGVATRYDDNDQPLADTDIAVLRWRVDGLDRIMSRLPDEQAMAYYGLVRQLGAYLLATRLPDSH